MVAAAIACTIASVAAKNHHINVIPHLPLSLSPEHASTQSRLSPAKADKLQSEEGQTPPTSKTTCAIVYLYFKQGMSAQLQATQNSSVKCTNTLGALHR